MKDQLVFDVTDANTILDSDSVGAYLRSDDGTLLTHTTDGSREALDVYTELGNASDVAYSAGDLGAMALAVRSDAGGSLVSADGDYSPLSLDSSGALRVNAVVNVDSLSDYAEDSAHSSGDIGGFVLSIKIDDITADNSALLAGTNGDYQGVFTNSKGEMYSHDTDAIALLTTIDSDIDNINTVISALSHAEDAAHVSGDTGMMALAVRNDTL